MKTLMKFLAIILITTYQSEPSIAQGHLIRNQGFFYGVEGFYGHGTGFSTTHVRSTDFESPTSYGLKVSANWFSSFHFSYGLAAGLLNYEDPNMLTFPVLINGQGYLSKGSNTPLVYAEAGYGFRFNHRDQDKGFIYEAGIGYRHRIKWSNFLVVKTGLQSFNNKEWDWFYKLGDDFDPSQYRWYDLRRQTLTLTVGFYYSTRY
ncbi:hypothetical protein [Sunxiuqinia sp. sy24]|uniref:hypothetical protein n=1 Tax=Sunxiuqinia sp. sy24 TaxID=3461495 RepID=UPI0040460177